MRSELDKPVVIFISNRFGYGPTITLLHIIRKFISVANAELVFAGSGICKEAFVTAGEPGKLAFKPRGVSMFLLT